MKRNWWLFAAGVTVAVVLIGASAVGGADAGTSTAGDAPLTGETHDKAVAAAVAHVGGGEMTDTELGDEGAAYGVEVRRPDGTHVEVNLDQAYAVTSTEADDDGPGDDNEPDDDESDDDAEDVNDNDGPNDPDDDPGEPAGDPND